MQRDEFVAIPLRHLSCQVRRDTLEMSAELGALWARVLERRLGQGCITLERDGPRTS
jgi:hypothetical protein